MSTLNAILKGIKDVPADRLEELYQFVQLLTHKAKHSDKIRKKILSFKGAFSDMSEKDYADFLSQTKKVRSNLLDRHV